MYGEVEPEGQKRTDGPNDWGTVRERSGCREFDGVTSVVVDNFMDIFLLCMLPGNRKPTAVTIQSFRLIVIMIRESADVDKGRIQVMNGHEETPVGVYGLFHKWVVGLSIFLVDKGLESVQHMDCIAIT